MSMMSATGLMDPSMGGGGDPSQQEQPQQPMTDSQSEQAFFDIANTHIEDKAPQLVRHMIGFQILDKDEDETRVAGAFGFRVGAREMYVPVFFLGGELKGYELLYQKDEDAFVPLEEGWIDFLLSKKPYTMGGSSTYPEQEMTRHQPDLQALYTSPQRYTKYSSEALLKDMRDKSAPDYEHLDLRKIAEAAGALRFSRLCEDIAADEQLASAVCRFYPPEQLRKIAEHVYTKQDEQFAVTEGDAPHYHTVTMINSHDDPMVAFLEEGQRERLVRDGMLLVDDRDDKDKSVMVSSRFPASYANPNESGLFDVLTVGGKFQKRVILNRPRSVGHGNVKFVLVIDPESGKFVNVRPRDVWTQCGHEQEWKKWFDGLSDTGSVEVGGTYVLLNHIGESTIAFKVLKKMEGESGTSLWIRPITDGPANISRTEDQDEWLDRYPYRHQPAYETRGDTHAMPMPCCSGHGDDVYEGEWKGSPRILLVDRPGNGAFQLGTAFVIHNGWKAFKLQREDRLDTESDPATALDIYAKLEKLASSMKIHHDGNEVRITTRMGTTESLSPRGAVVHLVTVHGLGEKEAAEAIQESAKDRQIRTFIQYAAGYPMTKVAQGGIASPYYTPAIPPRPTSYDSQVGVDQVFADSRLVPLIGTTPRMTRSDQNALRAPDGWLRRDDYQNIVNAGQTGRKEFMDTAILGAMVRSMGATESIDKFLPDLARALDRVGRIIFAFYWHADRFIDRYGSDEMPELEDSLKNVFTGLGDLVLYLKQRAVEPTASSGDINLDDIS